MTRAYWTVVAQHRTGALTRLGCPASSWQAAEDIASSWRAAYRCPVYVLRVA